MYPFDSGSGSGYGKRNGKLYPVPTLDCPESSALMHQMRKHFIIVQLFFYIFSIEKGIFYLTLAIAGRVW